MKKRVFSVLVPIIIGLGCLFLNAEESSVSTDSENMPPAVTASAKDDPFEEDDPFNYTAPTQIQVQVEFVELSQESLTQLLLHDAPKTSDATDLRIKLQELIDQNEAKMLETMIAVCRSGQKATTGSFHEFIYPTEFEPISMEDLSKKQDKQAVLASGSYVLSPATPTAFETRNIGSKLEVEVTAGEDLKVIDLMLVPELAWHTGNTVWHEQKDKEGNIYKIQMPDIYTMSLNTTVTCFRGEYTLAGALTPKDSKGEPDMTRKVMVFAKCNLFSRQMRREAGDPPYKPHSGGF